MAVILEAVLRRTLGPLRVPDTRTADSRPVLSDDPRLILEPGASRVTLDFLDGDGSPNDETDFGYAPSGRSGLANSSCCGTALVRGLGAAAADMAEVSSRTPYPTQETIGR